MIAFNTDHVANVVLACGLATWLLAVVLTWCSNRGPTPGGDDLDDLD